MNGAFLCLAILCQNSAKPERGIETNQFRQLENAPRQVRTALSPNAGLKQQQHQDRDGGRQGQNSAKPERGIETACPLLQ